MELPGLSSRPGIGVQEMIRRKFGRSVSPSSQEHAFFLVASFGRCKYKLSPPSVGAILQATIGGSAADFAVLGLADRVFRFSVSLSLVGFHIVKLCSFECSSFTFGPMMVQTGCLNGETSAGKKRLPGLRFREAKWVEIVA
jgi:hypothetical protein